MRRFSVGLVVLVWCLAASRADALPIGVFSWGGDTLFGPVFTVENFSNDPATSLGPPGASFSGILVDLVFADGSPATSLALANIIDPGDNTIDPGESAQNFELPLSFDIVSASLRLAFPLDGTVALLDAAGDPIVALTGVGASAQIDFTPADVTPVPEPSTLLLVGAGLLTARVFRRRTR